ncbi:hypothetical protein FCH28_21250 [Streptomyces piniterrae]|uniref:Uncharacterized protein n=1 Tax=Streptomyces piniterrae TaxID=2571125 RepID=A0A4V5MJX5_9ACTN|nr:hypothetical protein [Streptomyces piniterrae]TJZ51028.1 hypothetical protein FCH28_21250 [Streptomyces piniterrae]
MKCVLEKSSSVTRALLSTENDDGTFALVALDIAWEFGPVVSAWLPARSRAARNLVVRPEVVFNLSPPGRGPEEGPDGGVSTSDIALTEPPLAELPLAEAPLAQLPLTEAELADALPTEPSEMVRTPRLADCPLQLEARCVPELTVTDGAWTRFEAQVLRVHADPRWVLPMGDRGIELSAWCPPVHDFRPSGVPSHPPAPVPARELAERLGRRFPGQRSAASNTPAP